MTEAVELAAAAAAAGTKRVVATPHVSDRYPGNTGGRITENAVVMRGALKEAGVDIAVDQGAEISLRYATELGDDELSRLRLGGGPWLLVELPFAGPSTGFAKGLSALSARGHHIVLAHPERVQGLRDNRPLMQRLVAEGMLCQLTAGALTSRFGVDIQRTALRLVDEGLVHVVASDAHSTVRRPPSMRDELEAAGFTEEGIRYTTHDVPFAILSGDPVPTPPPLVKPRRTISKGRRIRRGR